MDYVCDHMIRTVVYDQGRISITLTRCGRCIECYCSKIEMPGQSQMGLANIGELLVRAEQEGIEVIIEGHGK